ncbi:NAD(P)-binding protein [Coniophora puteana RWD-64-598 SS2]|uniref:NAD(P)-binding protein n=1 Tax=Coniophora puteana (strain RWD-64-598) TaxID=741705 RepID=A0A5M3N2M3_CONPW|nr:NAD(P)-binding protein [Coniophora puteana RWD-64-598 SS2]EIW85566.1 NAD(P)-binding protein [Coniophora puteana RWD-64-598 SS2]
MSNTFKSFAIIGAGGYLGRPIYESLLASSASKVVVLSRPDSDKTFASHPKQVVEKVKLDDVDAVAAVLKKHGVEVLVSAIAIVGFGTQTALADAAKRADVQLFVPSEFGIPSEGAQGLLGSKAKVCDYAKSIGLPFLRLYTGLFMESIPSAGSVETGKFVYLERGTAPLSVTSIIDIGGFLAHVLTTLTPAELQGVTFRIEGERTSFAELAALYHEVKGLPAESLGVDRFRAEVPKADFKVPLASVVNEGKGVITYCHVQGKDLGQGVISNGLWEGHSWKSAREVIRELK